MSEEQDRIQQIRTRRSKSLEEGHGIQQQGGLTTTPTTQVTSRDVSAVKGAESIAAGGTTPLPWLQDRVSLSLEAQIAMIEMRSTYKLSLADIGYQNRQQIIPIRDGIFLKVEPTGCYRMVYNNRV